MSTIIRVDRSVIPVYPDWMDGVIDPELERTGLAEYDLATDVALWLHDDQKSGSVAGQAIYDYLKKHGLLESCLGLSDALAIQKLGVAVFQKVFDNKRVYFWKSVRRNHKGGDLFVPYLFVFGRVVLHWHRVDRHMNGLRPAVRFVSPPATPER